MSDRLVQELDRVEVITPSGRVLVCRPCGAEAHFQDAGRTIKVFIDREPHYLALRTGDVEPSAFAEHCAECGEPVPLPPGYWVICQTCAATAKALLAKAKETQPCD